MQENEIQAIVAGQRQFFFGGKTLPLDYRIQALKRLKQAIVGNQKKIADALQQDLGKSEAEGFMCETGLVLSEISYMLRHIRRFAREKTVYTPLSQFAAGSRIRPTPYGVTLIMSPWNYPFLLTVEPLVDALGGRQYRCGQAECLFAGDKCCGGRAPFIGFSARICGGGDRRAGGKPVPAE